MSPMRDGLVKTVCWSGVSGCGPVHLHWCL